MFRFFIHLELIFIHGVKWRSNFILFNEDIQFYHHLLKISPAVVLFPLCSPGTLIKDHSIMYARVSGFLIYSICLYITFYANITSSYVVQALCFFFYLISGCSIHKWNWDIKVSYHYCAAVYFSFEFCNICFIYLGAVMLGVYICSFFFLVKLIL